MEHNRLRPIPKYSRLICTPLLGQKLQYPVYNCFTAAVGFSYVQIIHCSVFEHWITIEISFDEEVRIFDSLFINKLSYEVKKQIASIVQTKHNQIELKLEKTQQQQNATDCGIFAIAFATDLCHGIDPVNLFLLKTQISNGFVMNVLLALTYSQIRNNSSLYAQCIYIIAIS